MLKTASNFQYFTPMSTDMIRVDTPGPTQSDIKNLTWDRVPSTHLSARYDRTIRRGLVRPIRNDRMAHEQGE